MTPLVQCNCGLKFAVPKGATGKAARCPMCDKAMWFLGSDGEQTGFSALLEIQSGPNRIGERLYLCGPAPLTVGKADDQNLNLAADKVSRRHCLLQPTSGGGWRVEDQNSRNGIWINGHRAKTHSLADGDSLTIGDYTLHFRAARTGSTPSAADPARARDVPGVDIGVASQTSPANAQPPDDDLYDFVPDPEPSPVRKPPVLRPEFMPPVARSSLPKIACPSCGKMLDGGAVICVDCGINAKTGRALVISRGVDENILYENTNNILKYVSWILPFGYLPIASEAYGKFKPHAMQAIAALTVLITVAVWFSQMESPSGELGPTKNLMLWCGRDPSALRISLAYQADDDAKRALEVKIAEIKARPDFNAAAKPADSQPPPQSLDELIARINSGEGWGRDAAVTVQAYRELPPEYQKFGSFHFYQLVTNAFLHAGIIHIVGNLIFLLIFGNRVNALVGQWKAVVLYLLLAAIASSAFYVSQSGKPLLPALGASGAIMGMAGMYIVLMPVSRVYMVIWLRLGLLTGFRRLTKIFAVRGFWVLLFWIAFDVWATVRGSHDSTAHWAHLGGFIGGMIIAIVLLMTRQVDAHGGDLLSLLFGRRAWAIIGSPAERAA